MKIISGKTGSPHVTSQQFRQIMEGIIGDESYIIAGGENLEPELVSNNALKIRSGMLCHHGNVSCVDTGTYDEVELENGSQGMKRIDLVVNRYTRNEETGIESCDWVVLKGTPAESSPTVPEYTVGNLQNGDLVDDCPVFKVELDGIQVTGVMKMLSVLGSDLSDVSALKSKMSALGDYTPMLPLRGYSGNMNNMPTGTFLCELAKCTNAPPYPMGMWAHVICYANFSQTAIFYNGSNYPPIIATRTYANNAWTPWEEQGIGHGFCDVWQNGLIKNALQVNLNDPYAVNNKTYYVDRAKGTDGLPSDCQWGIREVCWFMANWVMVRITGYSTNSKQAIWTNFYTKQGGWNGWTKHSYGIDTLTQSGLSINSGRCKIISGGYYVQNKIAHVQMKIQALTALSSRNYWVMIRGFPQPATESALAITKYNALGKSVGCYVQKSLSVASGEIVITTAGDGIDANEQYIISGDYVVA